MPRSPSSRIVLSKQASVLRTSLLLSLGLTPLACGGTTLISSDDGAGGGRGGTDQGGAAAQAGSPGRAGYGNTGGTAGSSAGAPPNPGGSAGGMDSGPVCRSPVFDPVSKLVRCANGLAHRAQALACTFAVPRPSGQGGAANAAGAGGADDGNAGVAGADEGSAGAPDGQVLYCDTNADCAALPNGYCDNDDGGPGPYICKPGCVTDDDCAGMVCACDGVNPGRCRFAGCHVDSDCGPGSYCAPVGAACGPGSFQCTSRDDECLTGQECASGICSSFDGHRVCDGAVCGRPFLIAEAPRLAAVEARADWLDASLAPNTSGLTPVQRAQLSAHWARLGQMEHASIAAFARFNLQLLSLGAASDLISACNSALADETAHARACFALASAYGGSLVGPARLDIERCFEDVSLTGIAKLVLREGCLGETIASLEALAVAEVAADPAVKRALARIARDELAHAELAFKFLRWVLRGAPAAVRDELRCEAERQWRDLESELELGPGARSDDHLAAHGLIGDGARRAIHRAALRDVARPLLGALFAVEASRVT